MKLENQVCTLDQAKRLKELGIDQESYFSWFYATDRDDIPSLNKASRHDCAMCGHPIASYFAEVSAYTVAEMMLALDMYSFSNRDSFSGFQWGYALDSEKAYTDHLMKPLAEGLGQMLIYRLETKTITAEEVNKRLQA